MNIDYVPLLPVQRELHAMPRGIPRFRKYLRTIKTADGVGLELPPLVAMNPMGREHVTALLDALLAIDADDIAARAVADAAADLTDDPGDFKAALVIADDLRGGWTNRYATEVAFRFSGGRFPGGEIQPLRWISHFWITGVLWSSEPAAEQTVREAILTALYRTVYLQRHGGARTLRDMIAQEGWVTAMAGCTRPVLDEDDLAYTREVLAPHLDATADLRMVVEYLFGDAAGRTLNFTPRGLSPWAGLALALNDARADTTMACVEGVLPANRE
jgi:hypothetical protein